MFLRNIRKMALGLSNIIFPKHCFICNKIILDGIFCAEDWSSIQFLQKPACNICFQPFEFKIDEEMICGKCIQKRPSYFKAIAIVKYDENSRSLITKLKYSDQTYMAKYFADLMFNNFKNIDSRSLQDIDFIAPVPLHKFRLISRRYNQSAFLAKHFSQASNIPVIFDLLIRNKNTKPQARLSKKSRRKNVTGAFELNSKYLERIKGKNILLIDDVITTGATIEACAKVLNRSAVNRVYVLSLAKTVLG